MERMRLIMKRIRKEYNIWTWLLCVIYGSSCPCKAEALTDRSTDTTWESGKEARKKGKLVQMAYPGEALDDRPQILCVRLHTPNNILLASLLYSGSTIKMFRMQDVEVDPKIWLCYNMHRGTSASIRVQCELQGPEPEVRVLPSSTVTAPPADILQITSQIRIDAYKDRGRAKLFWLLLIDRHTFKGLAEGMVIGVCDNCVGGSATVLSSSHGLAGIYRFCGIPGNSELLAIGNVWADQQCKVPEVSDFWALQMHARYTCNIPHMARTALSAAACVDTFMASE